MDKIIIFYELLGIDLNNLNHPISKLISLALKASGIDEIQIKQKLRMLGLALMDIKDYDENIFDYYTKKTQRNADFSLNGYIFLNNSMCQFNNYSKRKKNAIYIWRS